MTLSPKARKWVRNLVDFGGLGAWALVYFLGGRDLIQATWTLVGASALALVVGFGLERRLALIPLFVGVIALVFGGLTLIFHDAIFLKIKPTIINTLFGLGLLVSAAMRKNVLKSVLGKAIEMPDEAWRSLTVRYGIFYLGLAALNEAVWRTQPEDIWVLFRFPGLAILTMVIFFTQLPFILKHGRLIGADDPGESSEP